MQVIINKLLVNYQVSGEGRVVVIVHGWGDDSKSFAAMQKNLAESYKVVTLDLPGFGNSSFPELGWSLEDFAQFLKFFIEKLELKVYAFIGHSNGGAILIKGLSNQFVNSNKLILIAPSGIRDNQKLRKKLILLGSKAGKLPLSLLPTAYQLKLRKKLYQAIKSDAAVNPKMIETFKKIVKQDVSEDATKLKTDTLLIYGKDDRITPAVFGEIYHKLIDKSQLEIIEGAGHFVHLQEFKLVDKLIKDFLK